MLTDKQRKPHGTVIGDDIFHEHNDYIRMVYEWLDIQKKIKGPASKTYALKHMIERRCDRYISTSDVDVATHMHPEIHY
ncbi:MAG: hypothetical protein ACTJHW_09410 [Paenalcaligenes sp.]